MLTFIGFVPLRKQNQVERLSDESVTEGGIIRPDVAQQKTEICKVLAIGPEVQDIKVGDYVQVRRYAGSDQKILGKDTVVVDYNEIMGIYVTAEVADEERELVTQ